MLPTLPMLGSLRVGSMHDGCKLMLFNPILTMIRTSESAVLTVRDQVCV